MRKQRPFDEATPQTYSLTVTLTDLAPGKVSVSCIKARPHPKGLEPSQVIDTLRRVGGIAQRSRVRLPRVKVVLGEGELASQSCGIAYNS